MAQPPNQDIDGGPDVNCKYDLMSHLNEIPLLGRQYVPKFWCSIEAEDENKTENGKNGEPSESEEQARVVKLTTIHHAYPQQKPQENEKQIQSTSKQNDQKRSAQELPNDQDCPTVKQGRY